MFHQILAPVGQALGPSAAVAVLPILAMLLLLGVLRRPAWQAALAGLVIGLVLAVTVWRMPPVMALSSMAAGFTFGLWPIMWIVFNALVLFNLTVATGRFHAFYDWVLQQLPNDRRVVLIVIGFCFGALLEGVAGFGAPVAITSAILMMVGFTPVEALTSMLIFDTAPVAFGALGAPVTTLAAVTHLPDGVLGAMIGRQLPFFALALPFYAMSLQGWRSVRALWPLLAVAGATFAFSQFVSANYLSYALADVISGLTALVAVLLLLKVWRPAPDPAFALAARAGGHTPSSLRPSQCWTPWLILTTVVIAWTALKVAAVGAVKVHWPDLDGQVFITLYGKPYSAVWDFQPLATGTAILVSTALTAIVVRASPGTILKAVRTTYRQCRLMVLTVGMIIGLAYLMNYAGLTYTLGAAVSSAGVLFPLLSPLLGWIAVFLSGSDTSGNALFGNLQVAAANRLHLSPVLAAAANSSGGVMAKMISPQNIATGVSTVGLKGQEGLILSKTFKHSVILVALLGVLTMLQQYVFPGMIPSAPSPVASTK